MYIEKEVQLMNFLKMGGKNKSVVFIILFSVYIYIYIQYIYGNSAYRAIETLKITAREIPLPRQP